MALSLLYALLGVEDDAKFTTTTIANPVAYFGPGANPAPEKLDDVGRALKYRDKLDSKQKKEVKQALYNALYHTVEYSYINPVLNMAIGKALCNAIIAQPRNNILTNDEIAMFGLVLRPIVADAIDERCGALGRRS